MGAATTSNQVNMTDTPFVQRMRAFDAARRAASALSEKIRIDEAMADLIRSNDRGETIPPLEEPVDYKLAQAGDREAEE